MGATLNVDEIVYYYDRCQVDYEQFWKLNSHLCMHYGYWDDATRDLGSALIMMNRKVAEFGGVRNGDAVLDAGCGVGGSSIFLASQLGCTPHGISLSAKQIEQCKENAQRHGVGDRTSFSVQNYLNTSFENETFDVVWGIESVCYAYDKIDFLREAFRVLKPGGRVVVADFFANGVVPGTPDAAMMDKWTRTWAIRSYAEVESFWTDLQRAGFVGMQRKDVTANVVKSIKRLYALFYPGLAWMYGGYALGRRTKENLLNAWSTYYQYKTYKRDLWRYVFYTAQKPQ